MLHLLKSWSRTERSGRHNSHGSQTFQGPRLAAPLYGLNRHRVSSGIVGQVLDLPARQWDWDHPQKFAAVDNKNIGKRLTHNSFVYIKYFFEQFPRKTIVASTLLTAIQVVSRRRVPPCLITASIDSPKSLLLGGPESALTEEAYFGLCTTNLKSACTVINQTVELF